MVFVVMRKNSCSAAEAVIAEARKLFCFLMEIERGQCGGNVDLAIHRVAERYGFDEGQLRYLRYHWRELKDVKGSLLERLREAYEAVYERQRRMAAMELEIKTLTGEQDDLLEEEEAFV